MMMMMMMICHLKDYELEKKDFHFNVSKGMDVNIFIKLTFYTFIVTYCIFVLAPNADRTNHILV